MGKTFVFVARNLLHEPLGIMYLIPGLEKAGYTIDVVQANREDIRTYVELMRPDFVGYSVMSGSEDYYIRLNATLKRIYPHFKSVWGGPHCTFHPEIQGEFGVDIVVRGEAESRLASVLEAGKAEGVGLEEDIDLVPFPDRRVIYQRYRYMRENGARDFITSRGCQRSCAYCWNHAWRTLLVGKETERLRDYRSVVDECEWVRDRWGMKFAWFTCDRFGLGDNEWIVNFCQAYRTRVDRPFFCSLRPADVTTETADMLAYAGCYMVNIALETYSDNLRRQILHRYEPRQSVSYAIGVLRARDIRVRLQNILGLPCGGSYEEAMRTLAYNRELNVDIPWASLCQCYKGTTLWRMAVQDGYMGPLDRPAETFYDGLELQVPHARRIERLHKWWFIILRHSVFYHLRWLLVRIPLPRRFLRWLFRVSKRRLNERVFGPIMRHGNVNPQ